MPLSMACRLTAPRGCCAESNVAANAQLKRIGNRRRNVDRNEKPVPAYPIGNDSSHTDRSLAYGSGATRERNEVLYVVWSLTAWPFFEWICRELHGRRYNFTFLLMHPGESPLAAPLETLGVPFRHIRFRTRSDLPRAAWEIYRFCRGRRFKLAHMHFMNACVAGLPASALAGIKVRLHTRHHASPHPSSHRQRWEL